MQNNFRNIYGFYETHIERFIPSYAFFSLIGCFAVNCSVYWITQRVAAGFYHWNLTSSLDDMIPLSTWWILIYVGAYFFWLFGYIYAIRKLKDDKGNWYRVFSADILGKLISGVIFIMLPTTAIRPIIADYGIFDVMTQFIYNMDLPYNLFPSLHCFNSWMCFIAIRRNNNVSYSVKALFFIIAVSICFSTLFTKQHVVADWIGAIALAEASYFICKAKVITDFTEKLCKSFNFLVFGVRI